MHHYPSALIHLHAIRTCVAQAADEETRDAAAELIDRLETHFHLHTLSNSVLLMALDAFRDIPGTAESVGALAALATHRSHE